MWLNPSSPCQFKGARLSFPTQRSKAGVKLGGFFENDVGAEMDIFEGDDMAQKELHHLQILIGGFKRFSISNPFWDYFGNLTFTFFSCGSKPPTKVVFVWTSKH